MINKEYLREKAKILSLMERHDKKMSWLDAERCKGEWLNKANSIWCTNEEFKRYRALDEDDSELASYTFCDKRLSGLKVDLYLPTLNEDHPLWVYVENSLTPSLDVMPISISDKPSLMVEGKSIDIPLNVYDEVLQFISINRNAILESSKNDGDGINDILVRLDGKTMNEYLRGGESNVLLEYFKVVEPQYTGLPIDIWVDEGGTFLKGGHAPRIKFPGGKEVGKPTTTWSSVLIDEKPMVYNLPKSKPYPSKVINKVIEFVKNNYDVLMAITKQEVSLDDVKDKFNKGDDVC